MAVLLRIASSIALLKGTGSAQPTMVVASEEANRKREQQDLARMAGNSKARAGK
jgi:hypothetical protein